VRSTWCEQERRKQRLLAAVVTECCCWVQKGAPRWLQGGGRGQGCSSARAIFKLSCVCVSCVLARVCVGRRGLREREKGKERQRDSARRREACQGRGLNERDDAHSRMEQITAPDVSYPPFTPVTATAMCLRASAVLAPLGRGGRGVLRVEMSVQLSPACDAAGWKLGMEAPPSCLTHARPSER
jgi:hypothetical protein